MDLRSIKAKAKQHASKLVAAFTGGATMVATSVTALAAGESNEAVSAAQQMMQAATGTLSIGNIVAIIVAGIGAVIGLFLAWWGVRKLMGMLMAAFKKGKVKL